MLAPLSDSCQLPLGNNEAAMLGLQGVGLGGGGGGGGGVNNLGGNVGASLGSSPPLPSFGFTQEQVRQ